MTTINDNIRQASLYTMGGLIDPRLLSGNASRKNYSFAGFFQNIKKAFMSGKASVG
jgi:hypothetical protein